MANNVTHNVHNLLHIVEDVRKFGPLDKFGAFRFENKIGYIKKLVRKGDKPLQQIAHRLSEIQAAKKFIPMNNEDKFTLEKQHSGGPVVLSHAHMQQFQILRGQSFYINCLDTKNNCILLKQGVYVECHNFVCGNDDIFYIIGKQLEIVSPFYSEPLNSNTLNIKVVKYTDRALQTFLCERILAKVCKMPLGENFVVFPIVHTFRPTDK